MTIFLTASIAFIAGYYFYPLLKIIKIYITAKRLEKILNEIDTEQKEIREMLEETLKDWKKNNG